MSVNFVRVIAGAVVKLELGLAMRRQSHANSTGSYNASWSERNLGRQAKQVLPNIPHTSTNASRTSNRRRQRLQNDNRQPQCDPVSTCWQQIATIRRPRLTFRWNHHKHHHACWCLCSRTDQSSSHALRGARLRRIRLAWRTWQRARSRAPDAEFLLCPEDEEGRVRQCCLHTSSAARG